MVYLDAATRRPQLIAAARAAFARDGVSRSSLRAVAAEADVPLGTLQHVFPTKEQLLRAVVEDVVEEIADVLAGTADAEHGLAHAIRTGVTGFWQTLVAGRRDLQVMQYELTLHALRTPGYDDLARRQYARYTEVVADWCARAAGADTPPRVTPDRLARLMVAGVDGLILQYASDPDPARAEADVDLLIEALVAVATT